MSRHMLIRGALWGALALLMLMPRPATPQGS